MFLEEGSESFLAWSSGRAVAAMPAATSSTIRAEKASASRPMQPKPPSRFFSFLAAAAVAGACCESERDVVKGVEFEKVYASGFLTGS